MYKRETIEQFLGGLSARTPAPGGGAACALAGATAASLGAMSAVFTTGEKYQAVEDTTMAIKEQFEKLRDRLLGLADDDAAAFQAVTDARKLPKATPEEKAARKAKVDAAMRKATEVPEAILAAALEGLQLAEKLLPLCNKHLIGDLAVAAYLFEGAASGAALQVATNTKDADSDSAEKDSAARAGEQAVECQNLRMLIDNGALSALGIATDTPMEGGPEGGPSGGKAPL